MPTPNSFKFSDNLPTAKDSADLYNNTMALLNFYNRPGEYKLKEQKLISPNESNSYITNSNLKDVENFSKIKRQSEQLNRFLTIDDYYKPVDNNKYYKRETQFGALNFDAPMGLYDKRIKPTQKYTFQRSKYDDLVQEFETASLNLKNQKASKINSDRFEKVFSKIVSINDPLLSDQATFYGYDPVQIKPFHMLTSEEKIARKNLENSTEHKQAVAEQQKAAKENSTTQYIVTPYGEMTYENFERQFGSIAAQKYLKPKEVANSTTGGFTKNQKKLLRQP